VFAGLLRPYASQRLAHDVEGFLDYDFFAAGHEQHGAPSLVGLERFDVRDGNADQLMVKSGEYEGLQHGASAPQSWEMQVSDHFG
jgi:hypothetical protein